MITFEAMMFDWKYPKYQEIFRLKHEKCDGKVRQHKFLIA